MTTTVKIECDGNGCHNQLDNNGTSDDVQQLIEFHNWHNDPTTDEYHYCRNCWVLVQAEYDEMLANGELSNQ